MSWNPFRFTGIDKSHDFQESYESHMQLSLRFTGVFSLTLMENKLCRGAGYADSQDGPYHFHTCKIVLFWRNYSKLEDIWSGNVFHFAVAKTVHTWPVTIMT